MVDTLECIGIYIAGGIKNPREVVMISELHKTRCHDLLLPKSLSLQLYPSYTSNYKCPRHAQVLPCKPVSKTMETFFCLHRNMKIFSVSAWMYSYHINYDTFE